jgi:hypothetical protein
MNLHHMRHIFVDAAAGAQVTTDATRVIWIMDIHSIEWGHHHLKIRDLPRPLIEAKLEVTTQHLQVSSSRLITHALGDKS